MGIPFNNFLITLQGLGMMRVFIASLVLLLFHLTVDVSAEDGLPGASDLDKYWSYGRSEPVPNTRKLAFICATESVII